MAEKGGQDEQQPQISPEISALMRDFEEKQRILKDRVILIGQSLVEERDKTFAEIQELKKDMIKIKEDTKRMKDILERMAEQTSEMARKSELMILQRQFDLFREK